MWDRRKLLLAAIVFTALNYNVTESQTTLDMAPDTVDDMYDGCRKEAMEKFIHSDLLQQEQKGNEEFKKAWSKSSRCSTLILGGIKEHTTALKAYADGDADFRKTFDNAVKTMGINVTIYEERFHFKSLHFLLMDSMKLLKPEKCKTVYALPETKYKVEKGSTVRFGGFSTVYSNFRTLKKWEDLEDQVIFNITSCFFVNLRDFCADEKDTVLLSPAEVFTVEEIKATDKEYTEIVVKHLKLDSYHNCYMFSRSPADVSTQWLVLVLVALSLFVFNC